VNLKPFVIVLMMAFVIVGACGIAAIVVGIKQLRDQYRRTVQPDAVMWFWLYLGIGVLSVVGVVIFVYGR